MSQVEKCESPINNSPCFDNNESFTPIHSHSISNISMLAKPFHERKNAGGIELTYNKSLAFVSPSTHSDSKRCEIAAYPRYLLDSYRFMYDKAINCSKCISCFGLVCFLTTSY